MRCALCGNATRFVVSYRCAVDIRIAMRLMINSACNDAGL
jgi:hypothetical protein